MPNTPNTPSTQTSFFSSSTPRQAFYAELCNALYDKSIQELAEIRIPQKLLQQRLASLTYHVNLATEKLFNANCPLELDVHNGSWHGRQASTVKLQNIDADKTHNWFKKNAAVGLNVPVYIGQKRVEFIELDAIDRIDETNQKLRLNKNGWFYFNGQPVDECTVEAAQNTRPPALPNNHDDASEESVKSNTTDLQPEPLNSPTIKRQLLKPSKTFLTAAVCGHCWNYRGKTSPRRLSLRELLLSTSINWQHYKLDK